MMSAFTAAVVIPARNEARRLPTCLSALLPQIDEDVLIVVVANNCTDSTAAAARASIPSRSLELIDCTLNAAQGVGEARRRGCARAISLYPDIKSLLTTDADCIAAPDWIARSRAHLTEVDAVCGRVEPIPGESGVVQRLPLEAGANEAIYRDMVIQFYDLMAPEPHNPYPHHGGAPGRLWLAAHPHCVASEALPTFVPAKTATDPPDARLWLARAPCGRRARAGVVSADRPCTGRNGRYDPSPADRSGLSGG